MCAASTASTACATADQITNRLVGASGYSFTDSVDTAETGAKNIASGVCGGGGYITCCPKNCADRAVEFGEQACATRTGVAAISACISAISACIGHYFYYSL